CRSLSWSRWRSRCPSLRHKPWRRPVCQLAPVLTTRWWRCRWSPAGRSSPKCR
ncbi:unnamed protein product, partial [Effrenium voratum]